MVAEKSGEIYAKAVKEADDTDTGYYLVQAIYSDEELVNVSVVPGDLTGADSAEHSVDLIDAADAYCTKVFLLEKNTLAPLCTNLTVE